MTWYDSLLDPVLSIEGADRRFLCALEHVRNAVGGVAHALAVPGRAAENGWPHARSDGLGRVQSFTRTLARGTRAMQLEGEPGGIDGGAGPCWNLPCLLQARTRLRALRSACETLAPLIRVQFLKLPARRERTGAPRPVALDILAIADAETQLAAVVTHLDRRLTTLQRAIYLAIHQQDSRILWARPLPWTAAAEGSWPSPTPALPCPLYASRG